MEVVQKEAKRILVGIMVLDVLFLVLSIVCGFFTPNTAYSLVYSSIYCYINFVATGYFIDKIIKKEPIIAHKQGVWLFAIKIIIMFISMILAFLMGFADALALFVPLLAPKLTYFIIAVIKKEV